MSRAAAQTDHGDFFRKFNKLVQVSTPAALEKGMSQAGFLWLRDSIMEINRVPLDKGPLRGSGSVFVGNTLIGTSAKAGAAVKLNEDGDGEPATELSQRDWFGRMILTVGFNTAYAAYQHEGIRMDGTHIVKLYQHSGTGKKFLTGKMVGNGYHYLEGINNVLKKEWRLACA